MVLKEDATGSGDHLVQVNLSMLFKIILMLIAKHKINGGTDTTDNKL